MSNRIPTLLSPYIYPLPTDHHLSLQTNVLGTSTAWLLTRQIWSWYNTGAPTSNHNATIPRTRNSSDAFPSDERRQRDVRGQTDGKKPRRTVVLVSFLHDFTFWKNECKRSVGLDLEHLGATGTFHFVDGLTLFYASQILSHPSKSQGESTDPPSFIHYLNRGNSTSLSSIITALASPAHRPGTELGTEIGTGNSSGSGNRSVHGNDQTLLILDNPSILLASLPNHTSASLQADVFTLRLRFPCLVLVLPADLWPRSLYHGPHPLTTAVSPPTPLDEEQISFLVAMVHAADTLFATRMLDSGVARDVSGVVTVSGSVGEGDGREKEVREFLYHVRVDGGIRVWERGEWR